MRAWVYSPRTDVFALGASCENGYLVFTERELKLFGAHIILAETWDAKVHARG
jgi:hypothetical protein